MRFLLTGVVLALALVVRADDKPEWQTHTSDSGKLSVQFPGKPKTVDSKSATQYVFEMEGGKAVFIAAYTPFPNKMTLDGDMPKTLLQNVQNRVVESLKGKLITSKDVKVDDKFPARDIDAEAPGLGIYRTRIIVTEERMYQVVVLGPKEFVDGEQSKKFMASFKVVK